MNHRHICICEMSDILLTHRMQVSDIIQNAASIKGNNIWGKCNTNGWSQPFPLRTLLILQVEPIKPCKKAGLSAPLCFRIEYTSLVSAAPFRNGIPQPGHDKGTGQRKRNRRPMPRFPTPLGGNIADAHSDKRSGQILHTIK